MKIKIILTGGGTGGHIFPAIAIADSLKQNVENIQILFIGAKGKMEELIVPKNNYKLETINISGLRKGKYFEWLTLPYKFFTSFLKCKTILKEYVPDVVVATGGFVSAPVVYAALKSKIKVILQEGNSIPGKVTKIFSDRADKVIVNFNETKIYLKRKDNVIRIAYPIRISGTNMGITEAKQVFGINNNGKTLFLFGGSQGSAALNKTLSFSLKKFYDGGINVIWQTGKTEYEKFRKEFSYYSDRVKIFDFIDRIYDAYIASDLIVCRAGISSIMEIAAMRKPAVLIPYPHAADNHQEKNAETLSKEKACIIMKEEELENNFFHLIFNTINDDYKLNMLSDNVGKFSDTESALKITKEILKTIKYE